MKLFHNSTNYRWMFSCISVQSSTLVFLCLQYLIRLFYLKIGYGLATAVALQSVIMQTWLLWMLILEVIHLHNSFVNCYVNNGIGMDIFSTCLSILTVLSVRWLYVSPRRFCFTRPHSVPQDPTGFCWVLSFCFVVVFTISTIQIKIP